ncbi:hypothetical protein OG474_24680 [Kribbella sp. NBC_01505]|uniref:hypothetical protein n=1 Tax=Kribbella sp. NBC_01505 TaxID=2903580 RepID=UPI003867B0FC
MKDASLLPTRAAGDVCGFVSKDSGTKVLGTSKFSAGGAKIDLSGGVKNEDGSRFNLAGCSFSTKETGDALKVSVRRVDVDPRECNDVATTVASGKAAFIFPAAEGQGYADAGRNGRAAVARLVRGDWVYIVIIKNKLDWRNPVDDAVALVRQTVGQLNLPATGKLPRPKAS